MTNDNNFDKTHYIKLLTKADNLKKNEETSLFNESIEELIELSSYGVILESQIY